MAPQYNIDLKALQEERNTISNDNSNRSLGYLSEKEADNCVKAIQEKKGFETKEDAFIVIAALCQKGATNQGGLEQAQFQYKRKLTTGKEAKDIITKLNSNFTMRKLAKTLGTQIQQVGFSLGYEGERAKKRQLEVGRQTDLEASWCSNYQTGNPDCPEEVRQWLVRNFQERFAK